MNHGAASVAVAASAYLGVDAMALFSPQGKMRFTRRDAMSVYHKRMVVWIVRTVSGASFPEIAMLFRRAAHSTFFSNYSDAIDRIDEAERAAAVADVIAILERGEVRRANPAPMSPPECEAALGAAIRRGCGVQGGGPEGGGRDEAADAVRLRDHITALLDTHRR